MNDRSSFNLVEILCNLENGFLFSILFLFSQSSFFSGFSLFFFFHFICIFSIMLEVSHKCLVCTGSLLMFENEVLKGSLETMCEGGPCLPKVSPQPY